MRPSSLTYVSPFLAFVACLALQKVWSGSDLVFQGLFVGVMLLLLVFVARPAIDLKVKNWLSTTALGVGVFVIWVAPDLLFPSYRHHWIFENSITGKVASGLSPLAQTAPAVVWLRALRAIAIVPIVEELFWRAWLMRWLISPKFLSIALGTWSLSAFWIVAIAFASEHGPYWDVGLAAGILYNWWMVRTKSLGDLIWAHAVTNGCLSLFVVVAGKWEYWL